MAAFVISMPNRLAYASSMERMVETTLTLVASGVVAYIAVIYGRHVVPRLIDRGLWVVAVLVPPAVSVAAAIPVAFVLH